MPELDKYNVCDTAAAPFDTCSVPYAYEHNVVWLA